MNGAHDMGGMQVFGPVKLDACDAPGASPFHADWERRVLAVTLAMGATGQWNIDMSRAARESLPPAQYLGSTYYEIWFEGLKKLLIANGLASADEMKPAARGPPQGRMCARSRRRTWARRCRAARRLPVRRRRQRALPSAIQSAPGS